MHHMSKTRGIGAFTASILLLCLFSFPQSGQAADEGVFTAVERVPSFSPSPPASVTQKQTNSSRKDHLAIRSRIVQINLKQWLLLHGNVGVQTSIDSSEGDFIADDFELPDPPPIGSMPVFNLFDDVTLTGVVEQVVPLVSGGYTISGDISEDELGLFSLAISGEGLISGDFITSFETFKIRSVEGAPGYYRIIELDPSKRPVFENDAVVPPEEEKGASSSVKQPSLMAQASSSSQATIDVMILYALEVISQAGSREILENKLHEVISRANQIFSSSGVQIKLRLVHHQPVLYRREATSLLDIENLQQGNKGLQVAHSLRDTYGADIVHLIPGISNEKVCGRGYRGLRAQYAFSISYFDCIDSRTFEHELGHNMDLRHDRYAVINVDKRDLGPSSYNYGYVNKELFKSGGPPPYSISHQYWRTVMAYIDKCEDLLDSHCPDIPRFSNAQQSYEGDPLGIPCCQDGIDGSADAARHLNEVRYIIASHRAEPTPNTAPVFPSGVPNQTLTQGEAFRLTLPEASGGNPPLFYSLSPSLPPGLSFNKTDRSLSGTPTQEMGVTTYTYTVTDSDGDKDSLTFVMKVSAKDTSEEPTRYNLEIPGTGDVKSGIHVISGWACDTARVEVSFNGGRKVFVPYGSLRADTASTCGGKENTGFTTILNYNNLRAGLHTIALYLDGVLRETRSFRVVTIGEGNQEQYLEGEAGEGSVLLSNGKRVYVKWEQGKQGFDIVGVDARVSPPVALNEAPSPKGLLETPRDGSIKSGVHVISGWVCSGESIKIAINSSDRYIGEFNAVYENEREDTLGVCEDTDNGFVSIFNYNNLASGEYIADLYVDDEWQDSARFKVVRVVEDDPSTKGVDEGAFVRGLKGSRVVGLRKTGKSVRLEWVEGLQGFDITDVFGAEGSDQELESLACSLEASLVSAESEQGTTIFFENRTREARSIYWLNFAGERVWYATLDPDASRTQQTYTGHVWIITDTDNRCLSMHKAIATPGTVTLQPDASTSTSGTGSLAGRLSHMRNPTPPAYRLSPHSQRHGAGAHQ